MSKILGLILSLLLAGAVLSACAPTPTQYLVGKYANLPSHYESGFYHLQCNQKTQSVEQWWGAEKLFEGYRATLIYSPRQQMFYIELLMANDPNGSVYATVNFDLKTQSYSKPYVALDNPNAGTALRDYIAQANLVDLAKKLDAEMLIPNGFTCP